MDFQLALNHKPPTWPTMPRRNSSTSTLMSTIWTKLRRTPSQLVPGAPPAATMRPTSSFFWTRAAIRSVCAHDNPALTL